MSVPGTPPQRRARRALALAVGFLVGAIGLGQLFPVAMVDGNSMLPTYRSGEYLVVNRLWRHMGGLRRGDVVVFRHGADVLVKRVGYLAGDLIARDETRAYGAVQDLFDRPAAGPADGLKVPAGCMVALGDNRPESDDSRAFGPVPVEDLLGPVLMARPAR